MSGFKNSMSRLNRVIASATTVAATTAASALATNHSTARRIAVAETPMQSYKQSSRRWQRWRIADNLKPEEASNNLSADQAVVARLVAGGWAQGSILLPLSCFSAGLAPSADAPPPEELLAAVIVPLPLPASSAAGAGVGGGTGGSLLQFVATTRGDRNVFYVVQAGYLTGTEQDMLVVGDLPVDLPAPPLPLFPGGLEPQLPADVGARMSGARAAELAGVYLLRFAQERLPLEEMAQTGRWWPAGEMSDEEDAMVRALLLESMSRDRTWRPVLLHGLQKIGAQCAAADRTFAARMTGVGGAGADALREAISSAVQRAGGDGGRRADFFVSAFPQYMQHALETGERGDVLKAVADMMRHAGDPASL